MRSHTCLVSTALALTLTLAAPVHAGEPTDAEKRAAAEAIFNQATELVGKRDFAAACPKFEEVVKLQPNGIGARLSLGDCYVYQGKLASAHATFGQAASMAALANQPERAVDAQEKAAAIAPRVSYLTIEVPPAVAKLKSLAVMRGGLVVTPSLFNVPVAVDNGYYTIVADAQGRKPFTKSIKITQEGVRERVTLGFEAAEPTPSPIPSPDPQQPEEVDTSGGMSPIRISGIVIGSVGLVAAAIGLGVGLDGAAMASNAPSTEHPDYEQGEGQRNTGAALGGVGGAAAIAGLIMIIVGSNEIGPSTTEPQSRLQWGVGLGSAWMTVAF